MDACPGSNWNSPLSISGAEPVWPAAHLKTRLKTSGVLQPLPSRVTPAMRQKHH